MNARSRLFRSRALTFLAGFALAFLLYLAGCGDDDSSSCDPAGVCDHPPHDSPEVDAAAPPPLECAPFEKGPSDCPEGYHANRSPFYPGERCECD